jgi:peptidoglycan/LPS O-acetylase OafA/YrhL
LLSVAWTLVFEMTFYVLFAVAILSRRVGAGLLVVWMALILAGRFVDHQAPLRHALMSLSNMEFIMGILAAHLTLTMPVQRPLSLAVLATVAFAASGLLENAGVVTPAGAMSQLLFALASVGLVVGLASAERQGRLHVGAAGAFLGNASYSIYLIHTIVIGLAARVLGSLGLVKTLPSAVVFILVALAAVAGGAALHVLVEQPLLRLLGTNMRERDRRKPALVV